MLYIMTSLRATNCRQQNLLDKNRGNNSDRQNIKVETHTHKYVKMINIPCGTAILQYIEYIHKPTYERLIGFQQMSSIIDTPSN